MLNNNYQFSEEAQGEKNKTHEVLEKGDDVGVDEVHLSGDYNVKVRSKGTTFFDPSD